MAVAQLSRGLRTAMDWDRRFEFCHQLLENTRIGENKVGRQGQHVRRGSGAGTNQ